VIEHLYVETMFVERTFRVKYPLSGGCHTRSKGWSS